MDKTEAVSILTACGIEVGADFFTLRSYQVDDLLKQADRVKYRKPKNANGSRGRYFHDFVQRSAR